MDNKTWDSLDKSQKTDLLKKAKLSAALTQLKWSSLTNSDRKKIEAASKGSGWFEEQEEVITNRGVKKKAPIHRKVAIKKRDKGLLYKPIIPEKKEELVREVSKEAEEPPKEWKKPNIPQDWYEDFKLKYDPNLPHEARTYYYEKKIAVGRKFYDLPDNKVKIWTIAHEVGHLFEQMTRELQLSLAGGEASKRLGVMKGDHYDGFMGGYNPSEAYADAIAEMYTRPDWLKSTHPKIYSLVAETVPTDWKEAIDYFISQSEMGAESEYRLYKSQGDGEFIATLIKPPYQVLKIDGSNIQYTSPHHEGHIMFQGREHAEGIQKALEDVTEVIQTMQDVLEKAPHVRAYYKFKLTDLKKDINFNKPHLNLVFGLRPVTEYFGRGSATISVRGIKFWWFKPEDSRKHFEENPYYSIEATPPATIAHEISHTLGSDNEFIDPLAKIVAIMFYTKHREYLPEDSFEYMRHEIGRITDDIVIGKPKRPAVTSELLRIFYNENPVELAAVIGTQYSREDGEKVWAFMAQEKKKAEMIKEKKKTVFQFTPKSYIEFVKQHPWGMYKITMIAGTKPATSEQNLAQINQWMAQHNYDAELIKQWDKEVKAENRYTANQILAELGIPFGLSEPAHKIYDPTFEESEAERIKEELRREPEGDTVDYFDTGNLTKYDVDDLRYSPFPEGMQSPEEEEFNDLFAEAVFVGAINTDPAPNKLTDPERIRSRWQSFFYEDPEGTIKRLEDLIKEYKK